MDDHREIQELLPWYVTGKLEPDELARVDAHLAACAECRADVQFQERLGAEVARMPVDVEEGWARLRRRVEAEPVSPVQRIARVAQGPAAWVGWGVAASLALVVGATVAPPMMLSQADQPGYHALGAQPAAPAGNVVVIFRPDVTEAELRGVLKAANARLVDGPTAADAWVLSVPAAERSAALATLKGRHEVVLAEPVDAGGAR